MANNTPQTTLRERVEQSMIDDDPGAAIDIINEIRPVLADPKLAQESRLPLERVYARLGAVAMKFLRPDDVSQQFEKYPKEFIGVRDEVDYLGHLKAALRNEFFVEDRNVLRDKWKGALERSEEWLGNNRLKLGAEEFPPGIGNWIRLYVSEMAAGGSTTLSRAKFFSSNEQFRKLDEKDRLLLRKIYDIYEYLKLRSDDPRGFEDVVYITDEQGRVFEFNAGVVKPLYDQESLNSLRDQAERGELGVVQLTELKMQYPEIFGKYTMKSDADRKSVVDVSQLSPEELQDRVDKFFETEYSKYNADAPKARINVPVATGELVKQLFYDLESKSPQSKYLVKEYLKDVFSQTEKFRNFMRQGQIGSIIQQSNTANLSEEAKQELKMSIMSPAGIQVLLREVLGNVMGLSSAETAFHAYEIIQSFPDNLIEFKTLVTYDPSSNVLVWRYS